MASHQVGLLLLFQCLGKMMDAHDRITSLTEWNRASLMIIATVQNVTSLCATMDHSTNLMDVVFSKREALGMCRSYVGTESGQQKRFCS